MSNLRLNSSEWHCSLAEIFGHIGDSDFPYFLANLVNKLAPYDSTAIYAFAENKPPKLLFHDIPARHVESTLTKYVEGAYMLDPIYEACMNDIGNGVFHLSELAPDHFKQSEYYNRYYRNTGLLDESVIMVRIAKRYYIAVSLGHRDPHRGIISIRSLAKLKIASPLLASYCLKHWCKELEGDGDHDSESERASVLARAFDSFGSDVLTKREQQITKEILKGHSGKSIARMLNISVETVKVHRKHINTKLGVSSHAQLFTTFIEHLTGSAQKGISSNITH